MSESEKSESSVPSCLLLLLHAVLHIDAYDALLAVISYDDYDALRSGVGFGFIESSHFLDLLNNHLHLGGLVH